jgi:hypothetical protein
MTKTFALLASGGIATLLLATGPAYAGQRPHAIVANPRIVTLIKAALYPPLEYDKPYDGELEIQFFSSSEDVVRACSQSDTACTFLSADHKKCRIMMGTEDVIRRNGFTYAFTLRHELAHCNGWKHPKKEGERTVKIGSRWDEAEGAKWLAANTKVPMPTLPALTRILPASPPVVCVTSEWKPEPCNKRKEPTSQAQETRKPPVMLNWIRNILPSEEFDHPFDGFLTAQIVDTMDELRAMTQTGQSRP